MRSLALALVFAPLVACIGGVKDTDPGAAVETGTPVACTEMAYASVMVHTVDPSGAPLAVNEVLYTVDGGSPQPAECANAAAAPCSDWTVGWEVAGDFVIEAAYTTSATESCCWHEDRQTASVTVGETADGCHVEQQEVTITLDPSLEVCLDTACP